METSKKEKKQNRTLKAPLVTTVKTASGKPVSLKQISPTEAKALRNSAYSYLA
ncbi:MAG: hypothetical protein M3R72_12310 [Bacteroidota bacterium]|nr:hypothetical protein [Bacteroidota bacterium]